MERLQATEKQIAQQQAEQTQHPESVTVTQTNSPGTFSSTTTVSRRDGKIVVTSTAGPDGPPLPTGAPTGRHHTVSGILRNITCTYPTLLTLKVANSGKPVSLYSNNYFKIAFTTTYDTSAVILPCTGIEDMKAKVEYSEVDDPRVAGQILAIELSK